MTLFQKKMGPVFIKENSEVSEFMERMQALSHRATGDLKKEIEKQIKIASYGELGENNIVFELKNSGIDMCVLHDIYIEHGDMSAQIDFLVITRKVILVIECKNLIGNIEIDNGGNFIRSYELFGKKVKEGIYSPITQNERHLRVLKEVRKESQDDFIKKHFFEAHFDKQYKSVVVLSNSKTYLNAKFAKKEVKDQVIRIDQLVTLINKLNSESKNIDLTKKEMMELAEFFLSQNVPRKSDYTKKYEELLGEVEKVHIAPKEEKTDGEEKIKNTEECEKTISEERICPRCGNKLVLRIAKKGENAGNKFYGCSRFPKCWYIENL
jgi:ssDNA-binding Zn-finger/Zn-ribbon topoisomerase 1